VTTVTYATGAQIFAPGSDVDTIHHIVSGYIRLYKVLPDRRSINLALLGPGAFFTQDRADNRYTTGVIAEAMSETILELYERDAFDESLVTNPDLTRGMLASQARQIAALHTLVEHLLARDTGVRLATTLLQLAEGFGRQRPDGRVALGLPITHQGLANMIGSNRVTVTRKLLEFQRSRAVVAEGRNNLSIDPTLLRRLVEPA
jgi:CRP/FNR family transcriptional regulator